MTDIAICVTVGILGACIAVLWGQTGTSPLLWLAWLLSHLEAVRLQSLATAEAAAQHFRRNYPKSVRQARREFAAISKPREKREQRLLTEAEETNG